MCFCHGMVDRMPIIQMMTEVQFLGFGVCPLSVFCPLLSLAVALKSIRPVLVFQAMFVYDFDSLKKSPNLPKILQLSDTKKGPGQ